jgi:hypothetical protein
VDDRSHGRLRASTVEVMTDTPFRPLLHTQSDLETMWRRLMTPLGFSGHTLWMVVVQDDRPMPKVLEIVETSDVPDEEDVAAFAGVLGHLAEPDTRFAFLRSRPGGGTPDVSDRAWARALHEAGRRAGARIDVVHLAHDHDVLPIALDDLLAEPA